MRPIDVLHLGRPHVICCWDVDGILVDPGPESSLPTLLAALDGAVPRAIALTHIHLDHAGATGALVRRFPEVEVWVHEIGVRHLVDPAKLLASASRLYGEENMGRLWGEVVPVPEANIRALSGGEDAGPFHVEYTPGHASHHVSYWHEESRTAFVGDVAGVRIPPSTFAIPPTPPPDIDVEAWERSLELVAGWRPERLALTHWGAVEGDVTGHISQVERRLEAYAALAAAYDAGHFLEQVAAELERGAEPDTIETYIQAVPPEQMYLGLERYARKRAEAA